MQHRLKFKKTKSEVEKEEFQTMKDEYKKQHKRTLVSPPRYAQHDEPISPPRKARRGYDEEEENFRAKLSEVGGEDADFEAYVPPRWQNGQAGYFETFANESDDEERYAERIRSGMWEKYHPDEARHAREFGRTKSKRASTTKRARTAAREEVESELREESSRQSQRINKELEAERQSFRAFWLSAPDEITTANIRYPSFDRTITESSVTSFLGLSNMDASDKKRVVRDVMRIFHPDKFIGRFKARIPATEYESIVENVSMIARILVHLLE